MFFQQKYGLLQKCDRLLYGISELAFSPLGNAEQQYMELSFFFSFESSALDSFESLESVQTFPSSETEYHSASDFSLQGNTNTVP